MSGCWSVDLGAGLHKFESEEVDVIMGILRCGYEWHRVEGNHRKEPVLRWFEPYAYKLVQSQVRYIEATYSGFGRTNMMAGRPVINPDMYKFMGNFFSLRNLYKYDALGPIGKEVRVQWGNILLSKGYQSRRERRSWGMTSKPPVIE